MSLSDITGITGLMFNAILLLIALKYFVWNSKKKQKDETEEIKLSVEKEAIKDCEIDEKIHKSIQQQYEHCNLIKGYELKEQQKNDSNLEKQIDIQYKEINSIKKELKGLSDAIIALTATIENLKKSIDNLERNK